MRLCCSSVAWCGLSTAVLFFVAQWLYFAYFYSLFNSVVLTFSSLLLALRWFDNERTGEEKLLLSFVG